jgi:hypothetical protein
MKSLLIVVFCLFTGNLDLDKSNSEFESELLNIAYEFQKNIMDEDKCDEQRRNADNLVIDIEKELKKVDKYSSDEIRKLKVTKIKAEALYSYIGVIGGLGYQYISKEAFYKVNNILNAQLTDVSSGEFCVDIKSVLIENYIVYLAENNSNSSFRLDYKYKGSDKLNAGQGYMGLGEGEIGRIYNNRKKPNQKKIILYEVTCKKF